MEEKSLLGKIKRGLFNGKHKNPEYWMISLIVLWIIAIVMYFLDILGPKGNSYIWIALACGVTIGTLLNIRRYNKKREQSNH